MEDVKSMRGRSFLLFVLLVGLLGPSLSFADLVAEDSEDNKWAVSYIAKNSVHATVNGQVTHGDGLHVR